MHELYRLEQVALEGYTSYNFPKGWQHSTTSIRLVLTCFGVVMVALTNFANITLSSLYFDITKDCLYANHSCSIERRGVLTVFEQTLSTITSVMAPVLPHLAEEIHEHWKSDGKSFFTNRWVPLVSVITA